MRWIFGIARIAVASAKLLVALAWALLAFMAAKKRALRAYEARLRREGIPESLIVGLVSDYDFKLRQLIRTGRRIAFRRSKRVQSKGR